MTALKEMALLNKFILKVIGGTDLTKTVQEHLTHKAAYSPEAFTTGDWVEITHTDIAGAMEGILATEYQLTPEEIPAIIYDYVYDTIDMDHLHGLEESIRKRLKRIEQEAEKRNPREFDF